MNVDLNDLVNCSFCNVTIDIRILSPGDDGALAQANDVTSTSTAIDALQPALTPQAVTPLPVPPPPPVPVVAAPSVPVMPVVTPPPAPPADQPVVQEPADAPPPVAPVADDTEQPATADAAAPPPVAPAATPSFAGDTTAVPVASAPRHVRPHRHAAVADAAAAHPPVHILPAFAPPPPPLFAPAQGASGATVAEVASVAAPTDEGRRIPRQAPPPSRMPPADGPYLGSVPGGQSADGPANSPAGLLALLVFLVPGFAQWLWAGAGLRPRALRGGRPERPG